jgi:proline iminopeptidase
MVDRRILWPFTTMLSALDAIALYLTAIAAMLLLSAGPAAAQAVPACAGNTINDEQRVTVDGASLYLLVRGKRCDAPLMLWLHGGPGGAETPLFRLYTRALEDTVLVAYWDQRGAGQSYDPKADPAQLTVDRHLSDLDVVVDQLRARYGERKVTLVGHSWGSALGLLYANRHSDKVSVVVGVNQFVSGLGAQQGQYEFVRSRAEVLGDGHVLEKLREIGLPPLTARNELRLQALVDGYGGLFHRRPSFLGAIISGTLRGYAAPWDIPTYIHANEVSLVAMQDELNALDLSRKLTILKVSVVFLLGRYDRQLDSRQAAAFFRRIAAPAKWLIWFEESAHNIPFEEPNQFMEALRGIIAAHGER